MNKTDLAKTPFPVKRGDLVVTDETFGVRVLEVEEVDVYDVACTAKDLVSGLTYVLGEVYKRWFVVTGKDVFLGRAKRHLKKNGNLFPGLDEAKETLRTFHRDPKIRDMKVGG